MGNSAIPPLTVREAITSRRSARRYTGQLLTGVVVDCIADLALAAPNAVNAQFRGPGVVHDSWGAAGLRALPRGRQ